MAANKTAAVHRSLRKSITGPDVEAIQIAAQKILDHFEIDYDIVIDGEYGPQCHRGIRMAAVGMGAGINNRRALAAGRCSKSAQLLIRRQRPKSKREIQATKRRVSYRQRMRKRWAATLGEKALRVARTLIGVMEQGGNNTGPIVDKIIKANGGLIGEPWCGDFVAYCYRLAGSKVVSRSWAAVRFLGFLTGMRIVSVPRPGDIVVYTFDHTGLLEKLRSSDILADEGNTGASGAVSDSATGGDGVYQKVRAKSLVKHYVRVTR